jgi:AcrR family transcriptional regulator
VTAPTKTQRSQQSWEAILEAAIEDALKEGLESITVGDIAKRAGMSKSGVFSRIGSREALQLAVIDEFDRRFLATVFTPALSAPRGLPRLQKIVELWLGWAVGDHGIACLYSAGAFEYDDRQGPIRDRLFAGVTGWRSAVAKTVTQAKEEGHLRPDLDVAQFVFELDAVATGLVRDARFLGDQGSLARAQITVQHLLNRYQV